MKKILILCGVLCVFAQGLHAQKEYKAYMISNAHFDSQWNWDVQTSIDVYIRNTMVQNFWLLERYPDYVFNFEGGVKYSWMKEYYPEMYGQVKEWIRRGRWNVCGSTWDATDPNIPSPESFFRNILLGQQFYREEFGVRSNDIFLPDCFGFGYTLPTIAAHAGLIGFSTQKLQWRKHPFYGEAKVPFSIGLWQGIDGSRLMAALNANDYNTRWDGRDMSRDEGIIALAKGGVNNTAYRYYGVGDRGGSPTIPTLVSLEKGVHGDGPLEVVSARAGQMYEDYYPFDKHPELPVYDGELLMDVHATGCYTSQAAMKRFNRRNEQLADAAERASVIAHWLGAAAYPAEELRTEWRRFIWHQFHDDLTGTSIPRAYTFSWNDELIAQDKFANLAASASGGVSRALDTRVKGIPVVVYNPVAEIRREVVEAEVAAASQPRAVSVWSPRGERVPAQLLGYKDGKARIAFAAEVGAVGYAVYDLRMQGAAVRSSLKATPNSLENRIYKLTLDANGDIASVLDKRSGRELVQDGKAFRLAMFTENKSTDWPAWEIWKETIDRAPEAVADDVMISVAEQGPLRATLKVSRRHGKSTFVQYISLTEGAADDRIDIRNEVDWQSENALLKAEFPMSVSNPEAAYDLGLGYIRRGNNTPTAYEVYAQQWADLTDRDGAYGVAVMNDCKYGWDKPDDHTLRLTLLHTPTPGRHYKYQSRQDIGRHVFTYSIVGHTGDPVAGRIASKAESLNQPLAAYAAPKHAGGLGREFSFLSVSTPQLAVKALKQAEDGSGYVLRLNEMSGKPLEQGEIRFAAPIEAAYVLNGVEERRAEARFEGNRLIVSSGRFAPSTYLVKLRTSDIRLNAPSSLSVDLPCNDYAFTVDAFNRQGNLDGNGNSYAAELVPEEVVSEGVVFRVSNDVERKNVVKCDGQRIVLPQGNYGRVYLLAASLDGDRDAEFAVDGKSFCCPVPCYSGFFGQWGHDGGDGFVKNGDLAYVGTHRHSADHGNESYVFTYMYKIGLPVEAGAKELTLPKDRNVVVFAVTMSDNQNDNLPPLNEIRALP
ncbi:alpha-mannosidase [uncultured Alistipes sp.]|uniref:alpha-mannosidase n=1 Tax=uncultured Alistipes sp. TaxID=538949 RepID=UPI002584B52B|nr:alpha-mannosidase [uncultured Alistipes sp.]